VKRHALDPFSLVFGTTFGLVGVAFLLTRVDIARLRWVWPVPIIALGALIIGLAARAERSKPAGDPGPDGPAE
jgi:hypothetical protein